MTDLSEDLQHLDRHMLMRMSPEQRVTRLVEMVKSGAGPRKTIAVVCLRETWKSWVYDRLKAVADGKLEDGVLYARAFHCTMVEQLRGVRLSDVIVQGSPVGWTMDQWNELEERKEMAKQAGTWRGR